MATHKGWHCAYELHYHFVFTVKYRKALMRPEVEAHLVHIAHEIEERYSLSMEAMGADQNHIHLLCSAHPKHSPGDIARLYKSITARQLFVALPALKKELWGGEFWSDGYYVASVGERGNWERVKEYVLTQAHKAETETLSLFEAEAMETDGF